MSDGSEGGTMLVKDINPGPETSFPSRFEVVGSSVFFFADDGANGIELFVAVIVAGKRAEQTRD